MSDRMWDKISFECMVNKKAIPLSPHVRLLPPFHLLLRVFLFHRKRLSSVVALRLSFGPLQIQ